MSHVFHQLYYHFAWATHSREPLIDRVWRPRLLEMMNEEVKTRGGWPIRHNAMPDHAHLLCRLPPTVLLAEFIGQLKGATSFRVNREIRPRFKLRWQEGYGVLTLRKAETLEFPGILIGRKNIIGVAQCRTFWKDTIVNRMIGLKAWWE